MKTNLLTLILGLVSAHACAEPKQVFEQTIHPVLKEFCVTCHSTRKQKGDLDLERFTSIALVKGDPLVWEHTLDQIRDKEMPPKGKPMPSPEQMKLLTDWMQGTLDDIALASAGDPGPVVLRRLSNMEYTYTI
ncbi:MAG: c-type cytochrome domain-containing protein, partial [Verrucomicrobiaceae bacterium]